MLVKFPVYFLRGLIFFFVHIYHLNLKTSKEYYFSALKLINWFFLIFFLSWIFVSAVRSWLGVRLNRQVYAMDGSHWWCHYQKNEWSGRNTGIQMYCIIQVYLHWTQASYGLVVYCQCRFKSQFIFIKDVFHSWSAFKYFLKSIPSLATMDVYVASLETGKYKYIVYE